MLADVCTTPCNPLWPTTEICICYSGLSTCNLNAGTCASVPLVGNVCEGVCEVSPFAIGLIVGSVVLILLCCCACVACCRKSETYHNTYIRMPPHDQAWATSRVGPAPLASDPRAALLREAASK